jgi:putative SOS response-associated peptidase YedK
MCGRYDLSENPAAIRARFDVPSVPEFEAGTDIRPTNAMPIVHLDREAHRKCSVARWGLVPYWAPDLKFGAKTFNARAETVAKAPSFRAAFKGRRCLVPMNAFFEWSGPPGHRVKHRIHPKPQELFALAGLWERWGKDGDAVETYTIITCPPNDALASIHNRMPVILDDNNYEAWLREGPLELLRPYPGELEILPPAP